MKRFIILLSALVFMLCACTPGAGDGETTAPLNEHESVYKDWKSDLPSNGLSLVMGGYIDARSRILMNRKVNGTSKLCYYSKTDGNFYVFCFDPACTHKSCLASSGYGFMQYCAYNDRFYYKPYDEEKIYSCSFDSSDIRLEYDFKKDKNDIYSAASATIGILTGKYLYVSYRDDDGTLCKYYYDVESKKLTEYTRGTGLDTYSFPVFSYKDKIYFYDIAGNQYRANADFTDIEPFIYDKEWTGNIVIYKNELILNVRDDENAWLGFRISDLETGSEAFIPKEETGVTASGIKWVNDKFIFFTDDEKTVIGKDEYGNSITVYGGGRLYSYDRQGKTTEAVLDKGSMFSIVSVIACGDDMFIKAEEYTKSEDGTVKNKGIVFYRYKITKSGTLEFVGEDEVIV